MSKPSNKTVVTKGPKKLITSEEVYKPVGPYSQAVLVDKTIYVSGVLGMDASSNMKNGIEYQTKQALDNLKLILEAGDTSLKGVVKTTILMADLEDFPVVNKIYSEYFPEDFPARATYQVAKLPLNGLIEIEAIALAGVKGEPTVACPCSQRSPC
ncbi:unnamed protein product, partial [Iphiclides podalirius]